MRRKWSRAVALLCIVYLIALLLFHRHLDPFSDRDDTNDVDLPKEQSSPSRVLANSTNIRVKAQQPHSLTNQLHQLEAGMTQLENEIAHVKSTLTQEIESRAAVIQQQNKEHEEWLRHQEHLSQRKYDEWIKLQENQKKTQHEQQNTPHQSILDLNFPRNLYHQQNGGRDSVYTQEMFAGNRQYGLNEQSQSVRKLRGQAEGVFRQPIMMPPAIPVKYMGGIQSNPADVVVESPGFGVPEAFEEEDFTNTSLVKIADGVAVYSAYHDDRLPNKPTVRFIIILSAPKPKRRVLCHFQSPNLVSTVEAQQYELCENHKKKYLGFIYSCPVPEAVPRARYTLALSSPHTPEVRVSVPVLDVTPPEIQQGKVSDDEHQYKYNLSVCVSPLFGSVMARRLVEFVELTRLLGVSQVFFYDFQLSSIVSRVLDFYTHRGWVTVLPWRLPVSLSGTRVWYHGQLVTNNDCLYRTMAVSRYTAFHDIDEFIVPHHPHITSLTELLPPFLPNDTCGYSFQSAFYDPGITNNQFPDDLMTVSLTARPAMLSKIRTKVLVAPRRVFEVGIHHISKQFEEKWAPRRYDSARAILHHYRECIRDYGMRCENWTKDTIIKDRYMPTLKDNMQHVVKTLRL